MGSIRSRNSLLFFDFRIDGIRCREQTLLEDTPANRKRLEAFMAQIDQQIKQGTFDYAQYFPDSANAARVAQAGVLPAAAGRSGPDVGAEDLDRPLFREFAEEWFLENEIGWKISHRITLQGTINKHLLPAFGEKRVSYITKGDILKFRSALAKVQIGNRVGLSPMRINHIMTALRMILNDAADRFHFTTPFTGIKRLRVPKTQVDPFSLEEVQLFLAQVRSDFRLYVAEPVPWTQVWLTPPDEFHRVI